MLVQLDRKCRGYEPWIHYDSNNGPTVNPNAILTESDEIMQTEDGQELEVE